MSKCSVNSSALIPQEVLKKVQDSNKGIYIEGLSAAHQREAVSYLTNKIHSEFLQNPDKVYPASVLKKETLASVESEKKSAQASITMLKGLDENEYREAINQLEQKVEIMDAMIANMDKLIAKSKNELKNLKDSKVTEEAVDKTSEDLVAETANASEVSRDRTDHGDNFSLELNSKLNAPGKLKVFLNFIKRLEFDANGDVINRTTFFGTEAYLPWGEVYDELHRVLEGVYPSQKAIMERLNAANDKAKASKNNSRAWLTDVIAQMEKEIANNSDIVPLFVRDMSKHHVSMEYVFFSQYQLRDGTIVQTLMALNDNSTTAHKKLEGLWRNNHLYAPIVSNTGEYDEELLKDVLKSLRANINSKTKIINKYKENYDALLTFFTSMGMEVPTIFIEELAQGNLTIYQGSSKLKTTAQVIKKMEVIVSNLLNAEGGADLTNIPSAFITGIAKAAIKFSEQEFSNVMRVGDKLVYTYTANHNFSNRVRKLKEGREDLSKVAFSNTSFYGKMLREENNPFKEVFGMSYVSLYPLVKKKSRSNDGATKLAELDIEVMSVGYAFRNKNEEIKTITFLDSNGIEKKIQVQKGSHVTPTMSDKTRVMLMDGYTFRVAKEKEMPTVVDGKSTTGKFLRIDDNAIDLYMDTIVQGEVDRIALSSSPEYNASLNLSSYNGKLFYLTPYLNNVFIDPATNKAVSANAEGAKSLVDMILDGAMADKKTATALTNVMKAYISKDLHAKVKQRTNSWLNLGLVNGSGKFSKHPAQKSNRKNTKNEVMEGTAGFHELAIDLVFSEEMSKANFFQLIAGDPAQYNSKGRPNKDATQTEKNNEEVLATYSVITKRLAAEIAPGDDADLSSHPTYLQIFLEDVEIASKNIYGIVTALDGKDSLDKLKELEVNATTAEGKEVLKVYIKSLVSAPYFKIDATDAQEYVTWKTHIDEMLRYGELDRSEHTSIMESMKASNTIPKSLLKKVLGPRKPVHSSTVIEEVYDSSDEKVMRKMYIKSSSAVLLPQVIKGTKLEALMNAMEKLEESEKKPVRAAYRTAVKVGFPKRGIKLLEDNGEFSSKLNFQLGKNVLELQSEGLRIQQSVPFADDKSQVPIGSQEKKLLFSGLLGVVFDDGSENGIVGSKLKEKYDGLYEELSNEGLKEFEEYIATDGKLNYRKLAAILRKELISKGITAKPAFDGLAIDKKTGEFKVPLWKSPYADEYMARINSIVKKHILKKKINGTSSVLVSEEGFTIWEDKKEELGSEGIIYSENFDVTKGLQGQRIDENTGEVLPAQIILPFKFRDSEGNLLNIKDFMVKGTNRIDVNKLPDNLRDAFSFRIPTQLQQSMAFVEVVGFSPYTMGDSVIATRDFVVQMGSDFDVDKLYSYIFNADYKDGVLTKVKRMSLNKRDARIKEIDAKIEKVLDKGVNVASKDVKEAVKASVKEAVEIAMLDVGENMSEANIAIAMTELSAKVYESDFADINKQMAERAAIEEIAKLKLERRKVKANYIKGIQNTIIDIHKMVMLNKEAMPKIMKPLGSLSFIEKAEKIHGYNNTTAGGVNSIISHEYNVGKLADGNAGMDGISMFSSDSILQAALEGNPVIVARYVTVEGETVKETLKVEFGNKYEKSRGRVGLTTSIKKYVPEDKEKGTKEVKPVTIAELISATQNISVDNAKIEAMAKINMNTTTANVYTLLHLLGFEEDITTYFMSQPILVDYVKGLSNIYATHAAYDTNAKDKLLEKLKEKYAPNFNVREDLELADFKDMDASIQLEAMIASPNSMPDFGKTQMAILHKFFYLQENAINLGVIKKYLNLDSKGLNKNFYTTASLVDNVHSIPDQAVEGLKHLIGEYSYDPVSKIHTLEKPTTLAGFDVVNGGMTLIKYFGEEFIESNVGLNFANIIVGAQKANNGRPLSDAQVYELRNNYVNYLNTNLSFADPTEIRKELFHNIGKGSLIAKLNAIRKTDYYRNNKFLSSLTSIIDNNNGLAIINFERVAGDNFNDDAIYEAFIDALVNPVVVDVADGQVNISEMMQQLAYYGILKGGRQGTSFLKYIPSAVVNSITEVPTKVDTFAFLRQYFQNNPGAMAKTESTDVSYSKGKNTLTLKDATDNPVAVNVAGRVYTRSKKDTKVYVLSEVHPTIDISNYNHAPKSSDMESGAAEKTAELNNGNSIFLEELQGKKLEEFYKAYDSSDMNDNTKVLFTALKKLEGGPVLAVANLNKTTDTNNEVKANYNMNTRVVTVDRKEAATAPDETIVNHVMHEHMHHLTTSKLFEFAKMDTSTYPESLVRVQENIHNIIENFVTDKDTTNYDAEKVKAFRTIMYSYYEHLTNANKKTFGISPLAAMERLATHPIAKEALSSMINGETLATLLESGSDTVMTQDAAVTILDESSSIELIHAASSIIEYMTVVPTGGAKLQEAIGTDYPKFLTNIKDFILDVLKSFGIDSDGTRRALADIYDVAGIIAEGIPVTKTNTEMVTFIGDTKVTLKSDAFVLEDGKEITKGEDSVMYSAIVESITGTMRTNIVRGESEAFYTPEDILNDKSATLYDKLFAYASLIGNQNEYKETIGIINNNNLEEGLKDSTEPKKPDEVPSKKPLTLAERIKAKATNKKDSSETVVEMKSLKKVGEEAAKVCEGGKKAENGLVTTTDTNQKWSVVKTLQGPAHTNGGVDINIKDGRVTYSQGETTVKAEDGLYVPNDEINYRDLDLAKIPESSEYGKLKYNPKTFNPHGFTGGAIAFTN